VSGWADDRLAQPAAPSARIAGAELTRARLAVGLTVTELARRLRISRTTFSMWESGDRAAARSHWPALGRELMIRPDQVAELFAGLPPSRYDSQRLPSLALARHRAGLTQVELASRLRVAATTVSMWESGGVPVSARLLDQVVQLLATDLAQLAAQPPPAPTTPDPRPLRCMRQVAGMSQREAAAHLRVAVGTLARYESGERVTPVAVVRRMAQAYRRPVREVLLHSGSVLPPLPPGSWHGIDIPYLLRALRETAGMSKEELGRAVGRSGQTVRCWEDGRRRPGPGTSRRLELVCRLPPGRLTRLLEQQN
jgi:transcriptional regulator with XRE-family HTH domain